MKAFKVLRKDKQGKYWSCVAKGKARVRYFVNRKINPPSFLKRKGYELFVFKSQRYAENFSPSNMLGGKVICEAEVGALKPLPIRCNTFELSNGQLVESANPAWPIGTRMVPWVRLLPRKKNEKNAKVSSARSV